MRTNTMPLHNWVTITTDENAVQNLHTELGIDHLFCRLLAQRGIRTREEARAFLKPGRNWHDPLLMADMQRAAERIGKALDAGEKMLLYGDYDVDGTTCVTLLYALLLPHHKALDYYLPDRDKEGYGVSLAGVEYARSSGATLLVVMDCGIKAHEQINLANSYGIDVIVCDHHLPEGGLPAAVAVLNPKRADCPYPYKELSGCGIVFKLAQALTTHRGWPKESAENLLDLVALSTACDIVAMTGENRALTQAGLECINRKPRTGFWALIRQLNRDFPLEVNDLVFGLGPLINAAGRLGDARESVRLMLATEKLPALDQAARLAQRNRERREVDFAMTGEAQRLFTEKNNWSDRRSIVLFDPEWHKGVIGIAASRMVDKFNRPSVILTQSEGRAVGSARSVPGFDLYEALQQCDDLFYSFGGHAFAAGMQMPVENVSAFADRFEKIAAQNLPDTTIAPPLEVGTEIRFEQINSDFWNIMKRFAPFGPQNRQPVFVARQVTDTGESRQLANNHVRFSVRQVDGPVFTGIGFGLGEAFEKVRHRPFDIAFYINEEWWKKESKLRLMVKDVK